MKPRSAKNKGQRASKQLRESLLAIFSSLEPDDVKVVPGGVPGEDLWLSPTARKLIPFTFEVKNTEKLNLNAAIEQARTHEAATGFDWVVAFTRNRESMKVCMELNTFLELLREKSGTLK